MKHFLKISLIILLVFNSTQSIKAQNDSTTKQQKTEKSNENKKSNNDLTLGVFITAIMSLLSTYLAFTNNVKNREMQSELETLKIKHQTSQARLDQANVFNTLLENLIDAGNTKQLLAVQAIKHNLSTGFAIDILTTAFPKQDSTPTAVYQALKKLYDEIIEKIFDGDALTSNISTGEFLKLREIELYHLNNIVENITKHPNNSKAVLNSLKILEKYYPIIHNNLTDELKTQIFTKNLNDCKKILDKFHENTQINVRVKNLINQVFTDTLINRVFSKDEKNSKKSFTELNNLSYIQLEYNHLEKLIRLLSQNQGHKSGITYTLKILKKYQETLRKKLSKDIKSILNEALTRIVTEQSEDSWLVEEVKHLQEYLIRYA